MREYTAEDFNIYYGSAFVRSPADENSVCQIMLDRGGQFSLFAANGDAQRTDHNLLEWRHVRCPPLGYRHLGKGEKLYYVSKAHHEGRPKGLNPQIIAVSAPQEVVALWNNGGLNREQYPFNPTLDIIMAQELHFPNFVSLKEAVERLENEPDSLGFALNYDSAITLGTQEHERFVGLFKGRKVCASFDGKQFVAINPSWEGIVERNFRLAA